MKIDITVPELAESVTEAVIGEWLKKPGEIVNEGEQLVDIETDKAILEITAPESGQLVSISKHQNERVESNEVIAIIDTSKKDVKSSELVSSVEAKHATSTTKLESVEKPTTPSKTSPAVRKFAAENNINIKNVHGTGKNGRVTKQDVEAYIESVEAISASEINDMDDEVTSIPQPVSLDKREDKHVAMTNLRKSIARRLVASQRENAMLTTFNEVNMQNIIGMRQRYGQEFEEIHGAKLGLMSFFIKATTEALKEFPLINASVDGDDIVYHNYFDIGIAVSTPRGLVVPVIRNADELSFAGVEQCISDFARRARENKVTIEELTGGTFTITNGGVFGSMLSTPIINPPQSAILGMHSIQMRPIAQDDNIVIAPMMYLALSYDHRIIDGREAVQFLVYVKNIIETPDRLLLQL